MNGLLQSLSGHLNPGRLLIAQCSFFGAGVVNRIEYALRLQAADFEGSYNASDVLA